MNGRRFETGRLIALIFGVLALCGAGYLFSVSGGGVVAGCGEGSSCSDVLGSKWSMVLGVSVAGLAGGTYLVLLGHVVFAWRRVGGFWRFTGSLVAWMVIFAAIWFGVLQAFVLGAFCKWCSLTHFCGVVSAVLFLKRSVDGSVRSKALGKGAVCLALAGVVVMMALGVMSSEGDRFRSNEVAGDVMVFDGERVAFYGGKVEVVRERLIQVAPEPGKSVEGEDRAVGILLSDFTCPHCLENMVEVLDRAEEIGSFADLYFLPAYRTVEAREIERVMLVVWKTDRDVFGKMVRAMVAGEVVVERVALVGYADELLGGELDLYLKSQYLWADQMLKAGQEVFVLNQSESRAAVLPQVMMGREIFEGKVPVDRLAEAAKRGGEVKMGGDEVAGEVSSEGSSLVFSPKVVELGRMLKGSSKAGVFRVKNTGEKAARIDKWRVTCGCVSSDFEPREIAAGEEVEIPFEFSSTKFFGKVKHGLVLYEEGVKKPVALMASADVWIPVKQAPGRLSFGAVVRGAQDVVTEMSFLTTVGEDVVISLEESEIGGVQFALEEVIKGRHYQLKASMAEMPMKDVRGEVVLKTDYPGYGEIKVPFMAQAVDKVQLSKKEIRVAELMRKQPALVVVQCYDEEFEDEFKVLSVECKGAEGIEAEARMKKGRGFLSVKGSEGFEVGDREVYLEIRTNHPEYGVLRVSVVD